MIAVISFGVGFGVGTSKTIDWTVDLGLYLLKQQNITLELDAATIKVGLFQYKNRVSGCMWSEENGTYGLS